MMRAERAKALVKALPKVYPDAHCELDFTTPLQLLIATILSAQCTDIPPTLAALSASIQ